MKSREIESVAGLGAELPGRGEPAHVTRLETIAILRPASTRPRDLLGIDGHAVAPADQHGGRSCPAAHPGDLRHEGHLPVEVDRLGGRERVVDRGGHRGAKAECVAAIREASLLRGIAEEADLCMARGSSATHGAEHPQGPPMHRTAREASHPREEAGDGAGEPFARGLAAIVDPHGRSLTRRVRVRVEVDRDEGIGARGARGRATCLEGECAIAVPCEHHAVAQRRQMVRSHASDDEGDVLLACAACSHDPRARRASKAPFAAVAGIKDDDSHRPLRAPLAR